MNLLEALKTNKPIKRKDWTQFITPTSETDQFRFRVPDLLATDYMVKPDEITLTVKKFDDAFLKTLALKQFDFFKEDHNNELLYNFTSKLLKNLGLEDVRE